MAGNRIKAIHTLGRRSESRITSIDESTVFSGDTMLNENIFLKFDG